MSVAICQKKVRKMAENENSCVQPAKGPILEEPGGARMFGVRGKEERKMFGRIGKEAPDFEASAFVGTGFKNVRLSD